MRTTCIRIVFVRRTVLQSEEGYAAPAGWRIVHSEPRTGVDGYDVTLAAL